ncbi:MAG: hypothetical protein ACR2OL_16625, partial [Anderseniella sp.]
ADVSGVHIETFHQAKRLPLAEPANTEQAQYSIKFPVAAALVRGRIGVEEVSGPALTDPDITRLANMIEVSEDDAANAAFPADRFARMRISLADGRTIESDMMKAVGDPEDPISDAELQAKFTSLAEPVLGKRRAGRLLETCDGLWEAETVSDLVDLVMQPADD